MAGVAIVMFSDLVDSTTLLASLGDDEMERLRLAHVHDVQDAVHVAGGRVVKWLGDGAMASFDSALGALSAAAQIQASVSRLNTEQGQIGIAARVGIAAGEPIPDGNDLQGLPVVIACRLCAAAHGGQVLVQDLVAALIASRSGVTLEPVSGYTLRGIPTPVRASSLQWHELAVNGSGAMRAGREPRASDSPRLPSSDRAASETNGSRPGDTQLPRILAAFASEPLVGRDREVALLRDAMASHGGRRATLILGEPGIGKTRLAAAAAADSHHAGAVVALARCPREPTVAFEPWVGAIAELALAGGEAWREQLARAAGEELSVLVPELSQHATGRRAVAGDVAAAEGARYRLLRGIGAALGFAAGGEPLLVVLDDAHWCDPASAEALRQLLDSSSVARLELVVTAREPELGRGHPVSRVLGELRRTRDLTELRLSGLDAKGLAALVAARVGRAITPRLAARLAARTAGNPFFAGELAVDLDEQGALRDSEALDTAPVPDAVAGLVEERLARLEPATERLLSAAAAIGPSAPVALAARAAAIEPEDAVRAVQQAVAERLVEELATAEPTIQFPHALIREALLASLGDAASARLHLAIARTLEQDPRTEPADLARHYSLAVTMAGPEPAIAAHRAAATTAADAHDHEQAATHLRSVLDLAPDNDQDARAWLLLELGEQELLAADLARGRAAFRASVDAARTTGNAIVLARAALGFAGGDIGFGYELSTDDTSTVALLREGLQALGDTEPRLALQLIARLVYAMLYSDDEDTLRVLVARAKERQQRLGDSESEVLAGLAAMYAALARTAGALDALAHVEDVLGLGDAAEACGRDDLRFRVNQLSGAAHYGLGRIADCDRAVERGAEIAQRLGSPRFTWEVDVNRGMREIDRGNRAAGEALIRRAGTTVRRLRPDIHVAVELLMLLITGWIYDGETSAMRAGYAAMEGAGPWGFMSAFATFAMACDGDCEGTRRRLATLLSPDLAVLRRADVHVPAGLCYLAFAATLAGDAGAGARLRPLLDELRPYLHQVPPGLLFGHIPEWHIGRLELLADNPHAAAEELRAAVARADRIDLLWMTAWTRVDLAIALHRRDHDGDAAQARIHLADGEAIAQRYQMRAIIDQAEQARAELEGREMPDVARVHERERPLRALTTRTGRRALATLVRGQDDAALERRFADPRRQRALVRALARGFQPAHAGGFAGVIAYELEPFAIDTPLDAPWRWAIEVDSDAGHARLLEPAPLDAAVTIYSGLADWVRVTAGLQNPVTAMAAGRCRVDGDVILAARLETMFGGR